MRSTSIQHWGPICGGLKVIRFGLASGSNFILRYIRLDEKVGAKIQRSNGPHNVAAALTVLLPNNVSLNILGKPISAILTARTFTRLWLWLRAAITALYRHFGS